MSERSCPICRKASVDAAYAPFCSKRCADLDLSRWFAGVYAIPAEDEAGVEDAPDAGQGRAPHI